MPRQARGHLPAGTYHVTTRTAGPIGMFVDDFDRTRFCALLERTLRRREWSCLAFILMPTHYHLLLEVPDNDLSGGMQGLNWAYARRFNARHGRKGHFVGERYHSGQVTRDRHLLRALRYIARNPVKAGLCREPADWYWGSYRGAAGLDVGFPFVDPAPLRRYFGNDAMRANELVRAFVDE
jgi:REP element-mobilizing transposase RayT